MVDRGTWACIHVCMHKICNNIRIYILCPWLSPICHKDADWLPSGKIPYPPLMLIVFYNSLKLWWHIDLIITCWCQTMNVCSNIKLYNTISVICTILLQLYIIRKVLCYAYGWVNASSFLFNLHWLVFLSLNATSCNWQYLSLCLNGIEKTN